MGPSIRSQPSRRTNEQVRATNRSPADNEERFRDFFDEALIPHVHEGKDSRVIRAKAVEHPTGPAAKRQDDQ